MVRLKELAKSKKNKLPEAFQFLNGAIKRAKGGSSEAQKIVFQFLNGAIKSLDAIGN